MTQKAIITNAVGQVEHPLSDFMFLYGPGTEIDMSCSLTWRGEFYVFGGNAQSTQISKLGCQYFDTWKPYFRYLVDASINQHPYFYDFEKIVVNKDKPFKY